MAKGYSLHIGLNHIDPKHYSGWDGRLRCCLNDANAMLEIAKKQEFTNTKMICDEKATLFKI